MKGAVFSVDPDRYPLAASHISDLANRSFILRWGNGTTAPLDEGFELFAQSVVSGLEATLKS